MQYRLIDAIHVPVTLRFFPKTTNGHTSYNHYIKLEPGKIYETDNPHQIKYLKEHTELARYNAQLESALKECNADFKLEFCKSCGGKVKKIRYHNVEVME